MCADFKTVIKDYLTTHRLLTSLTKHIIFLEFLAKVNLLYFRMV